MQTEPIAVRSARFLPVVLWAAVLLVAVAAGCGSGDSSTTSTGDGGGDATACQAGQTACGNACSDTSKDPDNCGSCGNACQAGQVCSQGMCGLSCNGGTTKCGQSCTNTQDDPQNCGACGTACTQLQVCSQGKCASSCGGGTTQCGQSCVDTKVDPANCGGCGTKCSQGQVCSGGSCGLTCGQGLTECGGDAGVPYCVDTKNDDQNCGGCGQACANGFKCSNGACTNSCQAGLVTCTPDGGADAGGPVCVNPQTDPNNCGGCGNVCPGGYVCSAGSCTLSCQQGLTMCTPDGGADAGATCVDTKTDNQNCGSCNDACGQGEACMNAVCTPGCLPPQSLCTPDGGAPYCSNLQTDASNCGVCGNACPQNNTCVAGVCKAGLLTVPPIPINGNVVGCTTNSSYSGRKVAVDPSSNDIYAVMNCAGKIDFTRSNNGGLSFSAPAALTTTGTLNEVAVAAGPTGVVYVAANTSNGIQFLRSTDGGNTWSAAAVIDSGASVDTGFGVSMATYKDSVYVQVADPVGQKVDMLANTNQGSGAFTTTNVALAVFPNDVLVDPSNGNVWIAGDNPQFSLKMSSDGGKTFGAVSNPTNTAGGVYSDWALANGTIFALVGGTDGMDFMSTATPGTSTAVTGIAATNAATMHAVAADTAGNAYVVGQGAAGVNLQQILAGKTTVASTRTFAGGTAPGVTAVGTNAAVVVFTNGANVFATVQTY